MCSSILIAFLVAVISSSAHGIENIFGVEINPQKFYTLGKEEVDVEIDAKTTLLAEIESFQKKVPPQDNQDWIDYFRKLVITERKIIKQLQVPLSHLNTDNLKHINDASLRRQISNDTYGELQKGLRDYLNMLETFNFSETVWKDYSFLGNPFAKFLGKINDKPESLNVSSLIEAFKTAVTKVIKAKKSLSGTVSSFTRILEPQKKKSQIVMAEIRNLNLMAIPNTYKKISESVGSLKKELEKLKSAIENVNKIPPIFQCFMRKRSWLDEIRIQLNNLDSIHRNLNVQLLVNC